MGDWTYTAYVIKHLVEGIAEQEGKEKEDVELGIDELLTFYFKYQPKVRLCYGGGRKEVYWDLISLENLGFLEVLEKDKEYLDQKIRVKKWKSLENNVKIRERIARMAGSILLDIVEKTKQAVEKYLQDRKEGKLEENVRKTRELLKAYDEIEEVVGEVLKREKGCDYVI